ncbi:phosphonate metabolism transcriptional regulator PhnF [Pontivivens ytuae]|uniref:Phosphonate metabolism transcriptional regulator PhnF n=1 Tax=Pontivivens ytuae TaxID=2789856 RepID=A0A7S9QBX1_9RHOB|nr:phosphonate metabolism transcriptional regulator PhnF [Pontivivens ytuae]QPH53210.1 phosphonate metabolism transcriptional regulator PhnF [Pontivivens ytuae]
MDSLTVIADEPLPAGEDRFVWLQIYDRLRQRIEAGVLPPGTRLPGEHNLAGAFGTTRSTLRQALARLQSEGMLVARKGAGVYVRDRPATYTIAAGRRFSEALGPFAGRITTRTLRLERLPLEPEAAEALGLPAGVPAIRLCRLRLLDGRATYMTDKRFHAERFPNFEAAYAAHQSVTDVFHAHDIPAFHNVSTRITGSFATEEEAATLDLAAHAPVMRMTAVNAAGEIDPIEYSAGVWPLGAVEFLAEP